MTNIAEATTSPPIANVAEIDNPIWHALTTVQASLASAHGLARTFPSDVSPLVGLAETSPTALADLQRLVVPERRVAVFSTDPFDLPADWELLRSIPLEQMICLKPPTDSRDTGSPPIESLTIADAPDMLALATATEPGPFLINTIRMGRYVGIRSTDGRLVAMAGQRLRTTHFDEVSAVCTDPAFRGRGHARRLVAHVANLSFAAGKQPILHVTPGNSARRVYESVGFTHRRVVYVIAMKLRAQPA